VPDAHDPGSDTEIGAFCKIKININFFSSPIFQNESSLPRSVSAQGGNALWKCMA
jgi:hypothetical protein